MTKDVRAALASVLLSVCAVASAQPTGNVGILIKGDHMLDGAGIPWAQRDIGITGDRISFVGHADTAGIVGRETIDANGLLVTPGFIDMHSHATPLTRKRARCCRNCTRESPPLWSASTAVAATLWPRTSCATECRPWGRISLPTLDSMSPASGAMPHLKSRCDPHRSNPCAAPLIGARRSGLR